MKRREMIAAVTSVIGGCSVADTKPVGDGPYPLFIAVIPSTMLPPRSVAKMMEGINELEKRITDNTGVRIPIALFPAGTVVQAISCPPEAPQISGAEFI